MDVVVQPPQVDRLVHGSESTVVVGKLLLRLEEGSPNENMCLQIAGRIESELTRCGMELMVRKASGSSVAGLVGRGKWGRAWASCWGWKGHLRRQGSARRIASLGLDRKEYDHQSCTWGMTWDYPKSGPDHPSWYKMVSEVYQSIHAKRRTACEYS
jgi:hypothetical protein